MPGSILLGAAQLQQTNTHYVLVLVCVGCVSDLTAHDLNPKLFRSVCEEQEDNWNFVIIWIFHLSPEVRRADGLLTSSRDLFVVEKVKPPLVKVRSPSAY